MTEAKDPWTVLGLEPGASEDDVKRRYAELVLVHPPDRDAERFAEIRAAHDLALDPRARARNALFGPPPLRDLDELLALFKKRLRSPAGARAWLDALQELS